MGNMTIATVFVVITNVLFFLSQAATLELNPSGPQFYNCQGSLMDNGVVGGNCINQSVLDTNDLNSQFPETSRTISETSGFGIIDTFTTIKNWLVKETKLAGSLLSGPVNFIKAIPGVPNTFAVAIGVLWYTISLMIIIAFFRGGE